MRKVKIALLVALSLLFLGQLVAGAFSHAKSEKPLMAAKNQEPQVTTNKKAGHKQLTAQQTCILRDKGTEPPFSGLYWNEHRAGVYRCAGCGQELFSSQSKFDSGSGWPSFYQAFTPGSVQTREDRSFGMVRTEITCSRCGGHLGHVFDDGPQPTGQRCCVNSGALQFTPEGPADAK